MFALTHIGVAVLAAALSGTASASLLVEDFAGGFDPSFNHFIHAVGDPSQPGDWELGEWSGDACIWLYPATDEITFDLDPGETVGWASVRLIDYCGIGCSEVEFIGTLGSHTYGNVATSTWEVYTTTGLGLGDIVRIELTSFEGAFDDVTIDVEGAGNCAEDVDGSGDIGFGDLLQVLSFWGSCPGCPEDFDGDGVVGFDEVLTILSLWGPCP